MARNPAASTEVLLSIVGAGPLAAFWIFHRPELPGAVYDAVVADPDPDVRKRLAESWYAPGTQRGRLRADPDVRVRHRLADGPHPFRQQIDPLPDPVYAELMEDPDPEVRAVAISRWPSPAVDLIDRLLDDPDPRVRTAAAARSWKRKPSLLREVINTPDDMLSVWWEAVPTARFEADVIADIRHRWPAYLPWLAENPHLPDAVVTQLATDPNPAVRLAVSMRYDLPDSTRRAIESQVGPTDRINPAYWARTADDTETMRRAAESDHLGLRRSAACNRRLPHELLDHLAGDDDFAVRLLLCENHPDAPPELLWRTFFEARVITKWDLLDHPNFPTARCGSLAGSDDPEERRLVARDCQVTPEVVDRLSRDPDRRVRWSVAADPRLPRHRVLALLHDDDQTGVATEAARNPHLPIEVMQTILTDSGIGH